MAIVLKKVALELSYLPPIIASPPHQNRLKLKWAELRPWKSVGVVLKMNNFSQNLTRVFNLENKLLERGLCGPPPL